MTKFKPRPGQVDFANVRYAPTFNAILIAGDKILLVKRSARVGFYPNVWNGVSGFLDDAQELEDKLYEELKEELGFSKQLVKSIKIGRPFLQKAPEYKKTWIVLPLLVEVEPAEPKLNWEATEAKWFKLSQIKKLDLVPGFESVLAQFF